MPTNSSSPYSREGLLLRLVRHCQKAVIRERTVVFRNAHSLTNETGGFRRLSPLSALYALDSCAVALS